VGLIFLAAQDEQTRGPGQLGLVSVEGIEIVSSENQGGGDMQGV
jgi:hypothetical protein